MPGGRRNRVEPNLNSEDYRHFQSFAPTLIGTIILDEAIRRPHVLVIDTQNSSDDSSNAESDIRINSWPTTADELFVGYWTERCHG